MALFGMPRGNATAWVSKPRHRSPPIRPGENNPGPDHGFKILRPGNLSRARHTSPPGKRGEAGLKTIGNRYLPPPASVSTFRPGSQHSKMSRTSPAKSKLPMWQASSRPNPAFRKNQKNTLFRSDTTDPVHVRNVIFKVNRGSFAASFARIAI
jgi:hypothetical protein